MGNKLSNRLYKLESKTELILAESEAKMAKLHQLEKLDKEDSIEAMFLKAEIEASRKISLIDILAMAQASKIERK